MLPIVNEVIGRRTNQTILACSSVKTVFLKIVNSKSASKATSINLKSTHHEKKKLGERKKAK